MEMNALHEQFLQFMLLLQCFSTVKLDKELCTIWFEWIDRWEKRK